MTYFYLITSDKFNQMQQKIGSFHFKSILKNPDIDSIGEDFVLLDNPIITSFFDRPFKADAITGIICTKGYMKGSINLKKYYATAPCFFIVLPDQILQFEEFSDDLKANFVIMSDRFANKLIALNIRDKLPLSRSVQANPWIPLSASELDSMLTFYKILKVTVRRKENEHREEIVLLLTQAFFLGVSHQFHKLPETTSKSKKELLTEKFIQYAEQHYKTERSMQFYADKLALTPKYLSKIIKENTKLTANEWINNYVVLEAKALLVSTDMTIQQISNELNFPSQSFFGKYFKRQTGVSPREYREKNRTADF